MKYQAVVFDLFGTLVDNFTNSEYNQVLTDMSVILHTPQQSFINLWRGSFPMRVNGTHPTAQDRIRDICGQLGVIITGEQLETAVAVRLAYSLRTLIPRPDALPTIKKLKSLGYKVGLVSDCSPETPAVWSKIAFAGIFDVTIFSCEAGVKKPDPRIYRMAAERLGVKPEDCLYVGDGSSFELTGALKVGMQPVLIRDPGENADTLFIDREMAWPGPKITNLKEVLGLI